MATPESGTIWASIRIKLDDLNRDASKAVATMNNMAKGFNNAGESIKELNKLGKDLSLKVTAPMLAASAAAVKMASDENEAAGGIDSVFKESGRAIKEWADTAAKSAGLSRTEVFTSATVLGASLKNMGMSASEAAAQTLVLEQRASDMAATFGTSTVQALDAIAAMYRGEADPIEKFGVGITEVTMKAKAMEMGLGSNIQALSQYQKMQIRTAMLLEQTADTQGKFAQESGGVGGKLKITTAELKNQAAEIGQKLIPIASQLLDVVRSLIDRYDSLDEATKENVGKILMFTAAIGPMAFGISKAIEAVNAMKVALLALSANPIGLAIAGAAALAYGLKQLGDMNNERMLEEVGNQFGNIGELAGVSAQKISDVQEVLARMSRGGGGSIQDVADAMSQISQDTGLTRDQLISIARHSEKITAEFASQLDAAKKNLDYSDQQKQNDSIRLSYIKGTAEYAAREAAEKEKARKAQEANNEKVSAHEQKLRAIRAEFNKEVEKTNSLASVGAIDKKEKQDSLNDARKAYIESLIEEGVLKDKPGTTWRSELDAQIEGCKTYNTLIAQQKEQYDFLSESMDGLSELRGNEYTAEVERIQSLIESGNLDLEQKDQLIDKLEKINKEHEDHYDLRKSINRETEKGIANMLTGFEAMGQALVEGENVWKAFARVALGALASVLEALAAELAARAAKAYVDAFYTGGASLPTALTATAGAGAAYTAAGIIRGYAGSFESGGIVKGSRSGSLALVGENGYDEVMFNTGASGQAFINQMGAAIADRIASQPMLINLRNVTELDGQVVADNTMQYVRNGRVRT